MKPWPIVALIVLALVFAGLGQLAARSRTSMPQSSPNLEISLTGVTVEPGGYGAAIRVSGSDLVDPRLHDLVLAGEHGEVCPNGRLAHVGRAPDHLDLTVFFPANECFETLPGAEPVSLAGRLEGMVGRTTIRLRLKLRAPGLG